jgi:hypothetical protein
MMKTEGLEQKWELNLKTAPPKDGETYLTYDELSGYQLTSWQTYESWPVSDDEGSNKTVTGFTGDNMTPTVWDGDVPDAWWRLPKF